MKLTGAAILVSRGMKVLQAAPAAYPYRPATETMGMADYAYVCWFRNHEMVPEDQDYEWPACILITAASESAALSWGDHLAAKYCRGHKSCEILRSSIDPDQWVAVHAPRLAVGEEASDEALGW